MSQIFKINQKFPRLDVYLTNSLNISRSQIKKMIDGELILVNSELVKKNGMELNPGDEITILEKQDETNEEIVLKPIDLPIDIVYEDDDLMIVNKPTNLLVYPSSYNEEDTLAARVKNWFNQNNIHDFDDSIRPGIVHRLDKDTSGLLIIAKNQKTLDAMINKMKTNQVKRKYYALVHNCFDTKTNSYFKISTNIGRSMQSKYKMQVNSTKDTKPATTIVKVLENISNTNALVECELLTGRTHQIRAHMQFINHPIVNDKVYGIEKNPSKYGQYLYCRELEFIHPNKFENIHVTLDMPVEFQEKIKELSYE